MRNKALLGLAALAVTAATAVAQSNVYSLNIVGYVNTQVNGPGLFNMIANPLKNGANTADIVLPATDSSQVLQWNGVGFNLFTYDSGFGGWVDDGFNTAIPTVAPGAGFFYYNPNPTATITFVGETATGPGTSTTNVIGANGFYMIGSKLPYGGAVDSASVNLPVIDGSQILEWNGSTGYITTSYDSGFGGWVDDGFNNVPAPTIDVGQGFFFYNPGGATNWVQSLP